MHKAPSKLRHGLLIALSVLGTAAWAWFCLMHEKTVEERWFIALLVGSTAVLLAFATRRVWFGIAAATGFFSIMWISSALKFAYLEVPAIAPDLYYFFTLDTVKVIGRYPLIMWSALAAVTIIPSLIVFAWKSDAPVFLARFLPRAQAVLRLAGVAFALFVLVSLLWPFGPYASLYGKPMWVAVNDESFMTDFVISFHDTQVHIPPLDRADPTITWDAPASEPSTVKPDVVGILEESTFDPTILAVCKKQAICRHSLFSTDARTKAHGLLGVHTFGGGTWTSEFALITGLDHTLFGNAGLYAPYNLAPRVQFSLARAFKAAGYRVVGLYPTSADFINGRNAYKAYGFDMLYDGPENGLDWHAEDPKVFGLFWKLYQKEKAEHPGEPLFFFMLTIHQHGPHMDELKTLKPPFDKPVFPKQLTDFENLCFTNYLERLTQSDAAMIALEKQILDRPEPTVLMHFGDHQPSFEGVINNMKKALPPDWGPNDHWATYYTIKANYAQARKFDYPELDIVYLGGLLQDVVGLAKDPYYSTNALMRERCKGRYNECKDPRLLPSYHAQVFGALKMLGE